MSAQYKPGDTVYTEFTTQVFATGVATNADSLPTGILNRNGTDTAVSVTVTNLDTGRYKASFVIPATYVPGDVLILTIAATVSSVSGKNIVWQSKLGFGVVTQGTATAGGASTITLQTALGVDNLSNGNLIVIVAGTGAGQSRACLSYVNSTLVQTVDRAWTTNPDSTSVYVILYADLPAVNASLNITTVATVTTVTNAVVLPSIPANWITAAGITAAALNGKGDWSTYAGGDTSGTTTLLARIGSPTGVSVSADIAAAKASIGSPWQVGTKYAVTLAATDVTGNIATDLQTIKTNTVSCIGSSVVLPMNVAGTTNITAGTITTVNNLGASAQAQAATAVWQDTTVGDFTVAGSIGKSLFTSGNAPGAASGLAIVGSNMGSVSSVTAAITLPSIPANWITATGINASALNGKGDWLLASSYTAAPTLGQISTQITADHGAGAYGASGVPTVQQISTQVNTDLTTAHGSGSYVNSSSGSGSLACVFTVNDNSIVPNPLQGAAISFSYNGSVVAGGSTSVVSPLGQFSCSLNAGTYLVAITLPGYTFVPQNVVVNSAGVQASLTMLPLAMGPGIAGSVTGIIYCVNGGVAESGVVFTYQAIKLTIAGTWEIVDTKTTTSGSLGVTLFPNLLLGGTYNIRRGNGLPVTVTIPTTAVSPYVLSAGVGTP